MTQPLSYPTPSFHGHLPINVIRKAAGLPRHPDDEYLTVPLVIYREGVRHVIGEATIKGDQIVGAIGNEAGEALLDHLFTFHDYEFSIADLHAPRYAEESFEVPTSQEA